MTAFGARRVGASVLVTVGALVGFAGIPLLTASAAAASPASVRAADPTGNGVVSGRLVLGTGGKSIAGAVTLHGYEGDSERITRTEPTSLTGVFTFTALPTDAGWTYVATSPYQGATFSTDRFTIDAKSQAMVPLTVFPSTTSAAQVSLASWLVWVDVQGATMSVQQDVEVVNAGTQAYAGTVEIPDTTDGNKAAIELPVAMGAGRFQYLGRFETCCGAMAATRWAHTRPISPGRSTGTLRYEAPVAGELTFPVILPTTTFSLLVPQGTTVTSPLLAAAGTSTDKGVTYDVYRSSKPMAAGSSFTVGLDLPGSSSTSVWPVVAGVVLLLLLVAAAVVWWVLRRRRAQRERAEAELLASRPSGRARRTPDPARTSPASGGSATGAAPPARRRTPPAPAPAPARRTAAPTPAVAASTPEVDVLADELALLDLAFESGSLADEAAYHRVRESIVARMVAAVREGGSVTH